MAISPSDKRLVNHATAIGYVCINWTWLENIVDAALAHLMNHTIDSVEMHCISVNAGFSDKLKMLRALASIRKPSDEWFDRMDALINTIDNAIRLQRNRVVHDHWTPGDKAGVATRVYARTVIKKPQARQPKALSTHEAFSMTVAEVDEISTDIARATYALLKLMHEVPGFLEAMA